MTKNEVILPPEVPVPTVAPGYYDHSITVNFSLTKSGDKRYFEVGGSLTTTNTPTTGSTPFPDTGYGNDHSTGINKIALKVLTTNSAGSNIYEGEWLVVKSSPEMPVL